MKKTFYTLLLLLLFFSPSLKAQTTDSTVNQLLAINESAYIGLPLDSIISMLPPGYTEIKVFDIRNTARSLCIKYPNKVWIELHVRNFLYMNPYDPNRNWNIQTMRTEQLYKTIVYKNTKCYRNCELRSPQ
jgi:hypothetical protein